MEMVVWIGFGIVIGLWIAEERNGVRISRKERRHLEKELTQCSWN